MKRAVASRGASPGSSRCRRLARLVAMLGALAVGASGCAARGGVPRPFPGAAAPPGAGEPAPPVAGDPAPPAEGGEAAPPPAVATVPPPSTLATALIATALHLRGTPYRYGGSDPSGFDCSGFVQWVYARHGTALPREVRDQYQIGRSIDRDDVRPGDLVFFETVSRGASHVGIALGGGEFVHAPSSRGVVRVERYDSNYWSRRWVGARRVLAASGAPMPVAVE